MFIVLLNWHWIFVFDSFCNVTINTIIDFWQQLNVNALNYFVAFDELDE